MASRRSRIKGIANIPQRRKPLTEAASEDAEESNLKSSPNEATTVKPSALPSLSKEDGDNGTVSANVDSDKPVASEASNPLSDQNPSNMCNPGSTANPAPSQSALNRRRLIKPAISLKAIQNSSTHSIVSPTREEPEVPKAQEEPSPPENANCSAMSPNILDHAANIGKPNQHKNDFNNKDISMIGITKLPLGPSFENNYDEVTRPMPPCSPGKYMNRARIKAVPRLGQRRPSFSIGSASESEDESKKSFKTNRKRNDSVCSAVSTPAPVESPAVGVPQEAGHCSPRKKQEFNIVIQRKCKRTEQSRKLAEARREFHIKFGNGKPDKQKLTMIDLIFYNPTSSPMSQKRKRKDVDTESVISQPEDDIDDAPPLPEKADADAEQSDEENTVPAPQIMVGANGDIEIDEKSLYVENKSVQREREKLQQSNIVDGDDFDTGYGIYKRPKRSKDWSKEETLRFYKALNTLGTDFTLMCGVFPSRSRRELKRKFSKEERINRALVDRALMNPIHFDLSDLERDLAKEQMEKARKEQLKKDLNEFKERRRAAKEDAESKNKENAIEVEGKRTHRQVRIVNKEEMMARMAGPSVRQALKNKLQKGVDSLLENCDNNTKDDDLEEENAENNNEDAQIDGGDDNCLQSSEQIVIDDDYEISSQDIPLAQSTQKDPEEDIISQEMEDGIVQEIQEVTMQELENVISAEIEDETTIQVIEDTINQETTDEMNQAVIETIADGTSQEIVETNAVETLIEGSIILSTLKDENGQVIYKAFTIGKDGERVPFHLSPGVLDILLGNNGTEEAQGIDVNTETVNTEENRGMFVESVAADNITAPQSTQELLAILDGSNDSEVDETEPPLIIDAPINGNLEDTIVDIASADCMILSFDDVGEVTDTGVTNIVAIDTVLPA